MYPNISAEPSAPSAPGFIIEDQHQQKPQYDQPPPYTMWPNYDQQFQQPQQGPQPSSVVVTQPTSQNANTTVIMDRFPSKSIHVKCFFCHEDVKTVTQARSNFCTWLLCAGLCFIGYVLFLTILNHHHSIIKISSKSK